MKKKIFLQVFLISLLSVTIVFVAGILAINRSNRTVLEERLVAETEMIAFMLQTRDDISQMQDYRNDGQFRVSIIDRDGRVIVESSADDVTDDHSTREEVALALAGEPRPVRRYSESFGCNMTYYALARTLSDGEAVVVRVAARSESIGAYLGYAIPLLLVALVLTVIVSMLLSSGLSKRVAGKIQSIAVSLDSIGTDKYAPLETDSSEPELCAVIEEINVLNERTYQYVLAEKKEKKKLSAVLDSISQGIIAISDCTRIVFVNDYASRLLGDGEHILAALGDMLNKDSADVTLDYSSGDADYVITVRHVGDWNLPDGIAYIVIVTDVTVARAVAKEKSDFFANASHELKTPITVMQGSAELILARETLDPVVRKQVERIHKEALRMSGLIADMLKLSNLELQGEEQVRIAIDLYHICNEVVSELSSSAEAKGVTVTAFGEGTVYADPKQIYELVGNLLTNAINYNKQGGRVEISVVSRDGCTLLSIRDSGIGIPQEHLPRICERFYRVDKSRSKKSGGTGLGLAIVKHICALYDAELNIESSVGVGTTVTVTFPS